MVRRQHGVIARRQLLELGFGRHAIDHRIAIGRLHPVHAGVYAVGRPELTQEGRFIAAVLACGPTARLSHASAAALWRIRPQRSGSVEVTVAAGANPRRRGIHVHRRTPIDREIARRHNIPVTTPTVTLIDLAPRLSRAALEAAVNEADKLDLTNPERLRAALDVMPPRPGVGILKQALDRHTFVLTYSQLERYFLPIAHRVGLPLPQTQVWLNGYRVDFYWPELGLVVEADSLRHHRTALQQTTDRLRDQAHFAAELTPLRFTHWQIRYNAGYVESVLRTVAARLGAAATSGPVRGGT